MVLEIGLQEEVDTDVSFERLAERIASHCASYSAGFRHVLCTGIIVS